MNNLEYTQKQFKEFIKKYDINQERIQLKIAHMMRVMEVNIQFAKWQNLDNENIELAGIIGLLHDIGRFYQVEKYDTFIDALSIDHCKAGVDLLFKENLIEYFVPNKKFHHIIEKAIENHGKFEIESGLDELTLLHCKLIRDSDKTDIYEVMLRDNPDTVFDGHSNKDDNFNQNVIDDFYKHVMVKKSDVLSVLDDYVRKLAFIYNYYFNKNLQYVKDKDYLNRMTTRFFDYFKFENPEVLNTANELLAYANNYLNNELKNY